MPIYEVKVPGAEKPRMVKAKDVASALAGIVAVKAISAERMIELQGEGVKLETAADPTDPASYAPGGPLHGQTPPEGVTIPPSDPPGGGEKDKTGEAGKDAGKQKES